MRASAFAARIGALALLAGAAACTDRNPVAGGMPPAPRPATVRLECTAQVRDRTITCEAATPLGVRGNLIVGGQNQYVHLASSNVSYDGSSVFGADVTLQNLMRQPMGTADGTTPDSVGNLIFFSSGPTVTSGTGTVTVSNPDTMGTFTSTNQPAFRYPGILQPYETSPNKHWVFDVPNTVVTFGFVVYVQTQLPNETGWIDVRPPHPWVAVGGTVALTDSVRTPAGGLVTGAVVTWTSSDTTIATVDPAGVVHAVAAPDGQDPVSIIATSGGRVDSTTVIVRTAGAGDILPPNLVSFGYSPKAVSIASGSASVTATLGITDVGTGVGSFGVNVTFAGPSNSHVNLACFQSSGTSANGVWTCTGSIPQFSPEGSWVVSKITLEDNQGNVNNILTADLQHAGYPVYLDVRGVQDNAPPFVTALAFAPDSVDVNAAPQTINFTLSAADSVSGVAQAVVIGSSPSGTSSASDLCSPTTTVGITRNFTCTLTIQRFVEAGDWDVSVDLQDNAGNSRTYVASELLSAGFPSQFHVTSTQDTVPPTLNSFTFTPDTAVVTFTDSAFVNVSLTATDNLSGVNVIQVTFQSPSAVTVDGFCSLSAGTSLNGSYTCSVLIPANSEQGFWPVIAVDLTDNAGQTRHYGTADLQTAGFKNQLYVKHN